MKEVTTIIKAYVHKALSNTVALSSNAQHKSNQFLNLLTTCNISANVSTSLPSSDALCEYQLIFIDCASFNATKKIPNSILQLASAHKIVLFNFQEGVLPEKSALLAGVFGIFYAKDRADIILKGIGKLIANERWFKRETMTDALAELLTNIDVPKPNINLGNNDKSVFPSLTKREKTIIKLVSSGAQNKEIANHLHISPNTVKTHIYSIFRKTSSRNRVELLSWTKQFQQVN